MKKLSTEPYKGTSDWKPEEFKIRKYIFDTWRKVCTKYGYEEYLTPIVEPADLYRAKSGEDVGGKELMILKDRAGRELAIRPEMTPSVTRMVSQFYQSSPKPIRLFSIANFMRGEKPQRGRNREFWQLNYDIFGSKSIQADIEVIQVAIEIMLEFNPPKDSFEVRVNSRKLIDTILTSIIGVEKESVQEVFRILDKWSKLKVEDLQERLEKNGLGSEQIKKIDRLMESESAEELLSSFPTLKNNEAFTEIKKLTNSLDDRGFSEWYRFVPNIIRGFDYYDGIIFEVFDKHEENRRTLFGGGRYNGLAELFGSESFPAVGCAPGDETISLFLESWDLLDQIDETNITSYYLPVLGEDYMDQYNSLAQKLRSEGNIVELGLEEERVGKALSYADTRGFDRVIILAEQEKDKGIYKIKDMSSGNEEEVVLN